MPNPLAPQRPPSCEACGRGAERNPCDDFTAPLKIPLLEGPVRPERRVPRSGAAQPAPCTAAQRGPAPPGSLRSSPPPHGRRWSLAPHPRRRHDTPTPLVLVQNRSDEPFTTTLPGGHRSRPTAAVPRREAPAAGRVHCPRGRETARSQTAQSRGRSPGRCHGQQAPSAPP